MHSRQLLCVGIAAAIWSQGAALDYTIDLDRTWDGEISTDEVQIKLTADSKYGDLVVDFSSDFYNSPIPPEGDSVMAADTCPLVRPYDGLWNYEVLELFFSNEAGQYIEIIVSPRGRYDIRMLTEEKGKDEPLFNLLPLFPSGVQNHNNPCLGGEVEEVCDEKWSATITIPRKYLPADVNKFNAYAARGKQYGTAEPSADNMVYLAFYPSPETPVDFHTKFGNLPELLTDIYTFPTCTSDTWRMALRTMGNMFSYNIETSSTCAADTKSDEYSCVVTTTTLTSLESVLVEVVITEKSGIMPNIPENVTQAGANKNVSADSESVWLSFTNSEEEQMRIGFNPYGAYNLSLFIGEKDVSTKIYNIYQDKCEMDGGNIKCSLLLSWDYLPANITHFQIIHVHKPLKSTLPMRADNDASTYEFVGSLCPAGKSNGQLDFVGCQTDAALVVDPAFNEKRSIIWEEAVEGNIGEEGNTTTATSTTTTTTTTKTTTTTTEAPGDAGNSLAASMTVLALAAMLALPSFWNDNICVLK